MRQIVKKRYKEFRDMDWRDRATEEKRRGRIREREKGIWS